MNRRSRGFTLIELMVAVAITAILARIAYSVYTQYVVRANRADAQSQLMQQAQFMERYYSTNDSYCNSANQPAIQQNLMYSPASAASAATAVYTLAFVPANYASTCTAATGLNFTLQATPVSTGRNYKDGFLQITSGGIKNWDKNNDGTISSTENTWTP